MAHDRGSCHIRGLLALGVVHILLLFELFILIKGSDEVEIGFLNDQRGRSPILISFRCKTSCLARSLIGRSGQSWVWASGRLRPWHGLAWPLWHLIGSCFGSLVLGCLALGARGSNRSVCSAAGRDQLEVWLLVGATIALKLFPFFSLNQTGIFALLIIGDVVLELAPVLDAFGRHSSFAEFLLYLLLVDLNVAWNFASFLRKSLSLLMIHSACWLIAIILIDFIEAC